MKPILTAIVLCTVTAALAPATRAGEAGTRWGSLSYPALGNLSLRSGTVEMWVRYDGDPAERVERYSRYSLLEYADPNGRLRLTLYYTGNDRRGGAPGYAFELRATAEDGSALRRAGGRYKLVPRVSARLDDPCRFHHVAAAWDLDAGVMWLALNGQRVSEDGIPTSVRACIRAASTTGRIVIGQSGRYHPQSEFVLDDIRISDAARTPAELAAVAEHPAALDPRTLLLDPLDATFTPDGETQTQARYLSSYSNETGGTPVGAVQVVPARHGRGLQLYMRPSNEAAEGDTQTR